MACTLKHGRCARAVAAAAAAATHPERLLPDQAHGGAVPAAQGRRLPGGHRAPVTRRLRERPTAARVRALLRYLPGAWTFAVLLALYNLVTVSTDMPAL